MYLRLLYIQILEKNPRWVTEDGDWLKFLRSVGRMLLPVNCTVALEASLED